MRQMSEVRRKINGGRVYLRLTFTAEVVGSGRWNSIPAGRGLVLLFFKNSLKKDLPLSNIYVYTDLVGEICPFSHLFIHTGIEGSNRARSEPTPGESLSECRKGGRDE